MSVKLLAQFCVFIILCSSANCNFGEVLNKNKNFIFFESTAYKDRSSFFNYGFIAIEELAVSLFWDKGDDMNALPDKHKFCSVIRNVKSHYEWVVIDVEHWILNARWKSQDPVRDNMEKYITIMNWARECRADLKFGLYATAPIIDHQYVLKDMSTTEYQFWKKQNLALKELVNVVDALFPSLYTVYDEPEIWDRLARRYISMAREIAGEKPIYPYIWPRYHQGNKNKKGQFVSGELWRFQLELVYELADGVVVWGGWRHGPMDWDENKEWWYETKDFISTVNK